MPFLKETARKVFSFTKKFGQTGEIKKYLGENPVPKLNVGSQTNFIDGWLNVDFMPFPRHVYMDATTRWPFEDNIFTAILCEHMIEHVPKDAGIFLISEAFRTLAPGGKIRFVTPNQDSFARMSLDAQCSEAQTYLRFVHRRFPNATISDAVNKIYRDYGHQHIFAPAELAAFVASAGFVNVRVAKPGVTDEPVFVGTEGHPKLLGIEENAAEAFAIDAEKPGH